MLGKENEGMIRLGGSRSVKKHTKRESEISSSRKDTCMDSYGPPQDASNHQEFSNNDYHLKFQSKTQEAFFPRPFFAKQNQPMSTTMGSSTFKDVRRQKSPNMKVVQLISEVREPDEQRQFQPKIAFLEKRVHELHQEKQNERIRLEKQNEKLKQENKELRQNLSECEKIKEMEVEYLQRELKNLKSSQIDECKSYSGLQSLDTKAKKTLSQSILSLKNGAIMNECKDQEISDKNEYSADNLKNENQVLIQRVEQNQKKLDGVKGQLEAAKNQFESEKIVIKLRNSNIIKQHQEMIQKLQREIDELKADKTNSQKKYLRRIAELELQKKNESEEVMKKQSIIVELRESIQRKEIDIVSLKEQNEKLKKSVEQSKNKQSCKKCTQLIKNLMKLNQKTVNKISDHK